MFFSFLEEESIPISPSFQQLLELVLQLQFICSKVPRKEKGEHLDEKRMAVLKETSS